jgi:DNA (cytosine-5)-methyltransferase 1
MNELALFAGAGGGILGGHLLGWRTVCAVEWEPYPASVLCARQNDGLLPPFPIWDDVQTFDGRPWRGIVDVVSGGFPCQDISVAGKGAGLDGERSGMWRHMARVVGEVRPRYVFVENSPMLVTRGLDRVLGDLTALGYDTRWTVMGAADVGANHKRDRIWIVATDMAYAKGDGSGRELRGLHCANATQREPKKHGKNQTKQFDNGCENAPHANVSQQQGRRVSSRVDQEHAYASDSCWWAIEPDVGRVANGVAARVDRLKAIGNGQVPLCAAEAWRLLRGPVT